MRRSVSLGLGSKWSWSLRRRLRSPLVFWLAATTVGVFTMSTVSRIISDAEAQRQRYGEWTWAAIATRDLAGGAELGPDDVRLDRLPRAMVPDSAWTEMPDGVRLRQPIVRGEVIVRSRTSGARSALSAQLEPTDRAIGVPLANPSLAVQVGDRVDVLALSSEDGGYAVVVEGATVIDRVNELATVSVPAEEADAVAAAIASGTAQLTLRSP